MTTDNTQTEPKEKHAGVAGIRVFVAKPKLKGGLGWTSIYIPPEMLAEMQALGGTRKAVTAACKLAATRCEVKDKENWSETVRKSALRALRHAKAYRDELEAEAAAENNKAWEQS